MSAYSQQTAKRQKVREAKVECDYFQGIEKVEYKKMAAASEMPSYRFYNAAERVHNRAMDDWLKFSVSLTEFRSNGSEAYGRCTHTRPWDEHTHTVDNYKRCIRALFEFCTKLGVKYWTAFDTDLIPWSDSWEETRTSWDEIVEYIQELNQRYHLKVLWIAPDLHSHPRYTSGALTSNDATAFIQAAAQIKKCLEVSQRLNAECFLLWPYREGYDAIFRTDVAREIKLFAKLLKITAEYKDRLNYRCQLLIMPYYYSFDGSYGVSPWHHPRCRERDVIQLYMWDVTSCLYLLKSYSLDRYYKVCSPPGHHMYMANVYNMLGGVTITNDMDQFDNKMMTLMMKCIIDQGTAPPGGVHLQLVGRRASDPRELLTAYVKYMDAAARGLRYACSIVTEQLFSKHLQQRYSTYGSGFGARLAGADISMEECEDYHKKNQSAHTDAAPSRCEHLELMFQRYLDASEHI